MITADEVRERLDYNPDSGVFLWKNPTSRRTRAGTRAGRPDKWGRIEISFHYRRYKAHRLAWLYVHGRWPSDVIDHINGDHTDNRIANLREATRSQNQCNRGRPKSNTSGFKGVHFCRDTGRWRAIVYLNGKNVYSARFDTCEEARAAYAKKAQELHGEFARLA